MKFLYLVRRHPIISAFFALILAGFIVLRLYFGVWVLNYVNHVLHNIKGYEGSVESIDLDLYRGAYRMHHLKILKKEGAIPTPFVNIDTVDLSVQWKALLHGRIVSDIALEKPIINFAVSKSGNTVQAGAGVDWTRPIKALSPVDINRVTFEHGRLTYQDFSTTPKVDIYIHDMSGSVEDLRNVESASKKLPSPLTFTGDSIGNGKLKIKGRLNILKQVPDMDIEGQIENINLRALNDYSNAYGAIDIRKGTLSVYSEIIVDDNQVSGYIKPIATNIALIDLHKSANPVKVVWESVVSVVLQIFTNLHKDQFATKIELEGNLKNVTTDTWSTIGGILHNAFISAMKKGLDAKP